MARPKNVLAVDDTPANLVTLDAVLGDSYNLVRGEALEILKARDDIDVILLDVQMPGLDGFETALRIKQMESARHIPIVFVTAVYREDPWVRKGYEVGGLDYCGCPRSCSRRPDTCRKLATGRPSGSSSRTPMALFDR